MVKGLRAKKFHELRQNFIVGNIICRESVLKLMSKVSRPWNHVYTNSVDVLLTITGYFFCTQMTWRRKKDFFKKI